MNCRHCQQPLTLPFIDLGVMPPSNAYLSSLEQCTQEQSYPLKVWVCENCWLAQTEDYTKADELFTADYAYFSSTSTTWVAHARRFVDQAITQLQLSDQSFVVELAANDGCLLQHFVQSGIPCLGVEPTSATAAAARAKDIEIVEDFFGVALANQMYADYGKADLIVANNVLAHVPDINDFVAGIAAMLKPKGVCSVEFPHPISIILLGFKCLTMLYRYSASPEQKAPLFRPRVPPQTRSPECVGTSHIEPGPRPVRRFAPGAPSAAGGPVRTRAPGSASAGWSPAQR